MTVTTPEMSVVPEVGERVPQAPEGLPEEVKVTWSPPTPVPAELVTVAVTEVWLTPSGGSAELPVFTATLLAPCDTVVLPDAEAVASLAVMTQLPAVLEAV